MGQSANDQSLPLSQSDRGEIDLVALFREVGRRKWIVLLCTLAALVLATLAVNMIKPRYTAEARVFLENRDTEYTRIGRDSARGSELQIDQDAVLSQVQLVMSREIARTMIQKFDLGSKREFDSVLEGVDPATKVAVMLGVLNNPASMSPEERVLEKYFDKLKAFAVAKSRVIAIEFQSRDPELASKISQGIAEEYIKELEAAKKGSARSAGSWLGKTIESLRERVASADAKVEIYRSQNGLFLVGDTTSISSQQLSELNTQLATARSAQTDLSSKARLIREAIRQGKTFEVSEVVNNELVRRLIESRATLRAQLAQEERTLLPQHPRIRELYAQLTGLEEQIRAAAERAARAFENDAKAAGARVAASQADLDLQKRQSGSANEQEVQLRALEREAKAEREQLETYLTRYRDASVRDADNAVAADARIVSRALIPSNPTFPKKLPIILIATLSGFALSLFWILMRALLSDRVYTRRAPEVAHHPMMGMYPTHGYPANMYPPNMYAPQMMAAMYAGQHPNPYSGPHPEQVLPQNAYAAEAHSAQMQQPLATAPTPPQPSVPRPQSTIATSDISPNHYQSQTVHTPNADVTIPKAIPMSAASLTMRESLDRMSEALSTNNLPLRIEPNRAFTSDSVQQGMEFAPVISPAIRVEAPISHTSPFSMAAPSMTSGDSYDPLMEIGEEARAALIRGRPVSILVLSVHGVDHAQGIGLSLERVLASYGPTLLASLDPDRITPSDLLQSAKGLAGSHDYVVFNGGLVTQKSSALSRSTTLTVLVASDDLEDARVDQASHALKGCNYFIVSASDAKAKERV
jgi:uncharacterized protein involved in exopolysaccharide biosynthesis